MRILIDTCVIMDAIRNREPFSVPAQQILLGVERSYFDGFISANQLTDLHYLMHKEMHDKTQTINALKQLCKFIKIIDTTAEDCRRALYSGRNDFEDALEIESALREDLDCIVTRNLRDFINSPIPVYTPEQFAQRLL